MEQSDASNGGGPYKFELTLPFPNAKAAGIAMQVLEVDRPLSGDRVERVARVEDKVLYITITSSDAKSLRALSNNTFEMLGVVTNTLREFDETAN